MTGAQFATHGPHDAGAQKPKFSSKADVIPIEATTQYVPGAFAGSGILNVHEKVCISEFSHFDGSF